MIYHQQHLYDNLTFETSIFRNPVSFSFPQSWRERGESVSSNTVSNFFLQRKWFSFLCSLCKLWWLRLICVAKFSLQFAFKQLSFTPRLPMVETWCCDCPIKPQRHNARQFLIWVTFLRTFISQKLKTKLILYLKSKFCKQPNQQPWQA